MKKYILAIDQGTTSTRAIIFDENAKAVSYAQKELHVFYPENGWVEQDAQDIWQDTKYVCKRAVEKAAIKADEIAAIGITNQRETIILWDKETGNPIGRAIVWQDRRTSGYCKELKDDGLEELFQSKTGLVLDPYFSGTKLHWLLKNNTAAVMRAKAEELLCGTIDTYLLWKMTGGKVHATDATNASRTMLYNIKEGKWDKELLEILEIPEQILPAVKDSSCMFGTTKKEFLGVEIPITGIAGDQHAAMFGQACFKEGMVKVTYGTGCFALKNIGSEFKQSKNKLLTTIAYQLNGKPVYAIEGSIFIAGAAIQWLRDGLQIIKHAAKTEEIAKRVSDNGGVYMVPAFTGLGAPYWEPSARAAIVGMTRDVTYEHIVRAALEAQAYQTKDLLNAMMEDSGQKIFEIRVDGGMVENNWMCQFLADMTGNIVNRPQIIETTALGAAYLAGLHVGLYQSLQEIEQNWQLSRKFEPNMSEEEKTELYTGWKRAIARVL